MDLRLTVQQAVARGPRIVAYAFGAARKNFVLSIDPFVLDYAHGAVASQILATFTLPFTTAWSIRFPVAVPSTSFVALVTWLDGTKVVRRKLWSDIGERIVCPLYAGETIPAGAKLEIWSVPDQVATLAEQWRLNIGFLSLPSTPADITGIEVVGTACVAPNPPPVSLNSLLTICVS